MNKKLLVLPLVLSACFTASAQAETELGAGFSLSGNVTITNDYRFRGLSQTDFRPAAQLGFDLTHDSGFYLGNWNSNVSSTLFNSGNLEMDFYGGWSGDIGGGLSLDVGTLYYYYPGSENHKGDAFDNVDLYVGLSYGSYSLKYSYTPTDFFDAPDSKGTWYLDGSAAYDLGDGWGLDAHVGYQRLKNTTIDGYVDYKLGVTKDLSGWVVGLHAVGASHRDWTPTKNGHPSGRIGAIVSLSKSF